MKKKGKELKGIRIHYNKKVMVWIIILLIILIGIIVYFNYFSGKNKDAKKDGGGVKSITECQVDSDCVPALCCHADSCVPGEAGPNCTGMFCTLSCSGPLDCGAGHCGCVNNKCLVVNNKS